MTFCAARRILGRYVAGWLTTLLVSRCRVLHGVCTVLQSVKYRYWRVGWIWMDGTPPLGLTLVGFVGVGNTKHRVSVGLSGLSMAMAMAMVDITYIHLHSVVLDYYSSLLLRLLLLLLLSPSVMDSWRWTRRSILYTVL